MADERYSTESNGRAGAGGVQTRGKSLLKGKKKTLRSLLVTAPTDMPNDEMPGIPILPYPCPEFPALDIIVVPG